PSPTAGDTSPIPTRSPFWLSVSGVWLPVEGIVPSSDTSTERARSTFTSVGGNRYEQRAALARRSWAWSMPWATVETVAAVRAAVESDLDVWLMSEPVAAHNMLPPRSCFGTELPAVDCGGVPLP